MYYSLQIGRALAALGVVLTHIAGPMSVKKYFGYTSVEHYLSFGTYGVQFFFVLSGFIIYSAHKEHLSKSSFLVEYLQKRFIRIYPIYFVVFLSVYFLAIVSHQESALFIDKVSIIKALFLISDFPVPIIGVAWTLEYEIFFYLLFALFILDKYFVIFVVGIFVYYNLFYIVPDEIYLYINFVRSQVIYLFLFGIIVAYLLKYKINISYVIYILAVGSVIIIMNIIDAISELNIFSDVRSLLLGLGFSFIIYSVVKIESKGFNFHKYKKINLLGDASYSLYLIHYPVISVIAKISMFVGLKNLGVLGAIISFFIMLIVSIVIALLVHKYIEKPLIKKLSFKRNL